VRAPLSWLRDFAPFPTGDPSALAAALDDLGLVVEGIERVGEGLDGVVAARVDEVAAIPGADRIRRVVVDAGDGPVEIVCGAFNFTAGDLVPLAPVGTVLPGGLEIARRKMRGVTSNGMLCSGRELGLSDDATGLLVLTGVDGVVPGMAVAEALGIEPDVVFDVTVEGNRPDAWSMAGVARDLAARLRLRFALPDPAVPEPSGAPIDAEATLDLDDPELCPRITARLLRSVRIGPSPRWLARRLSLAGMRPVNNVVDATNYVMLELGQPTHAYDLDRLAGGGLLVRRARPGETLVTLDGVGRTLGLPGRGLGDTGEDCVICDADGDVVGVGGVMGGERTAIDEATTRVLLEAAYFVPMAVARTSKRLGLRTEASARFERGCDPWGIDRAADRVLELLAGAATPAPGVLDRRGHVPEQLRLVVPVGRVGSVLGVDLGADEVASLLEPMGFGAEVDDGGPDRLTVVVPTNRPDVRPAPHGIDDVIEEVARGYGYARLPRRQPSWPQPGRLTPYQRDRRLVRQVLRDTGALEAWTPTLVDDGDHVRVGLDGPAVAVANPLVHQEAFLRRSLLPGLLRALAYNADRRQGDVRLFEVGTVFEHPAADPSRPPVRAGSGGATTVALPAERELLAVALAADGDDARPAVGLWRVLAEALRLEPVRLVAAEVPGLHPTRTAELDAGGTVVGWVGEVDPAVVEDFGATVGRRVGWLSVDLGLLLDPAVVRRRPEEAAPVSRFPSADVDLALVAPDELPAEAVAEALRRAGGPLLEALELFDVYRGAAVGDGRRSLAFHLRLCALDHTLTDEEVGVLRQACIDAAAAVGASLR